MEKKKGFLEELAAQGVGAGTDPNLTYAQSAVMGALLRQATTGLIRHSIWVALVLVSVSIWAQVDSSLIAVNFAFSAAALYWLFNPPEAFASIRKSDLTGVDLTP